MNRTETLQVLAILRGAYPNFYKGMDKKEANDVAIIWEQMFAEDSKELVAAAVKALIVSDEQGYPPHIGAVKAKIRQITQPQELNEAEAWALVVNAVVKKGCYRAQEAFDELPKLVQRIVGSPSQLIEWGSISSETFYSVIASNFQKSYRKLVASEREFNALPSDVRELVGNLSGKMVLGNIETPALGNGEK